MTCHVVMSASHDCLLESEVRTNELAPQSVFEVATRTLTTSRVPLKKSKLCDLFLAGIRGTDGKRQQLACLGVGFRSGVTKEQRRPQVKSHAGGSLAARQDPDFFFDRNVHL